jgi:hypothetical protein
MALLMSGPHAPQQVHRLIDDAHNKIVQAQCPPDQPDLSPRFRKVCSFSYSRTKC